MMRRLLELASERSRTTMQAVVDASKGDARRICSRFDPLAKIQSTVADRLRSIDDNFGAPLREAKEKLKLYNDWSEIRSRLEQVPSVKLAQISPDIRRNELRRELIAGSVQCFIEANGEKSVRASKAEASGPPPYFKRWIRSDTRAAESRLALHAQAAGARQKQ